MTKRIVFYISDRTGITAETLGNSLISQFEEVEFEPIAIPYTDTPEKAHAVVDRINNVTTDSGQKAIVFSTVVDPRIREIIVTSDALCFDFFNTFIKPMEQELESKSTHVVGRTHGVVNFESYKTRIDAINFVLNCDDGANVHQYHRADIILVGISRCGKTPTSLYLALQYGIRVANYPFTSDELEQLKLPKVLQAFKTKLYGLSIDPLRLQAIRQERLPDSRYASLEQCRLEVQELEQVYQRIGIPFINSTSRSIEEIATTILDTTGVQRRLV